MSAAELLEAIKERQGWAAFIEAFKSAQMVFDKRDIERYGKSLRLDK